MADQAHEWTDAELERLERRMAREYSQATREMTGKQRRMMRTYQRELEARERALDNTPEAMEAHRAWLRGQAASAQWAREMSEQLADAAVHANERALSAVRDEMPRIYTENANRAAYEIDRQVGMDTSFTLVDEDTVRLLMRNEGSPILREVVTPKVDRPKDYRWNREKFTSAITQGILQGESIPQIVRRTSSIFGSNRAAAVRAARTACTSAENAGRISSYERARRLGIDMETTWVATLDGRTRASHRAMDGEVLEGEEFSNGLRYPGDPAGDPSEVYNCRCTLRAHVTGFDGKKGDWDSWAGDRWARLPQGTTYEGWRSMREAVGPGGRALTREESYRNKASTVTSQWLGAGAARAQGAVRQVSTAERIAELEQRAAELDAEAKEAGRTAARAYVTDEDGSMIRDAEAHRDAAKARMDENAWAKDFNRAALENESMRLYSELAEVEQRYRSTPYGDPMREQLRSQRDRLFEQCGEVDRKLDAHRSYQRAKRQYEDYDSIVQNLTQSRAESLAARDAGRAALEEAVRERNRVYGELSEIQPFMPHVRSSLGDGYAEAMERMVSAAEQRHPEIARAFRRFSSQMKVAESDLRRGAFYSSTDRGIHFHAERTAIGDDVHAPYQTAFHEFAHLIDHLSGYGYTYTSKWRELEQTIKSDWVAYRNAAGRRLGVTRNRNSAAIQELVDQGARRDHLRYGSLSDIIEGCTGESYPLGIGHGASYHRGSGATGMEFFAEVFDGALAYEASYQELERVFPNAVRKVVEMAEEMSR